MRPGAKQPIPQIVKVFFSQALAKPSPLKKANLSCVSCYFRRLNKFKIFLEHPKETPGVGRVQNIAFCAPIIADKLNCG